MTDSKRIPVYGLATMRILFSRIALGVLVTCCTHPLMADQPLQAIRLPPPDTSGGMPLMRALSQRMSTKNFERKAVPLDLTSALLWAATGINRPESGKRTAASAMNCQDIEIFVVLEHATYRYDPNSHQLITAAREDLRSLAATQDYAKTAPINLVYVSDHSKMAESVADRKAIYAAFHAGSISQNVYLFAASAGLGAVVRDSVDRAALRTALNLRQDQVIVMAQSVGYAATQ